MKSVSIQSYSGPYSVQMRENTPQNNSDYGYFLRSELFLKVFEFSTLLGVNISALILGKPKQLKL